ncbi:glycosyltransferase [Lacticaseibacillus jixiensis]|uniref:glycosyltransferase n=1 Tax=Lacticaseibacillus jixiensis TaxID=3231926 RepID=UPI0036F3C140
MNEDLDYTEHNGRVAVLLSTYNGEKFLEAQLNSIEKQDYENLQLIVRDDGSVDGTVQILMNFSKHSRLQVKVIQGINVGPARGFWELLHCKGINADYFAYCDQDDVWDADKISRSVEFLTQCQENVLYFSNCRFIDAKGKVFQTKMFEKKPRISLQRLFISGVVQGCAMVMTRDLREHICDSSISSLPMHDVVTMLYALDFGRIVYDENPRFSYRSHSGNVVDKQRKSVWKKIRTRMRALDNGWHNSYSTVAEELLINNFMISTDNKKILGYVRDYKTSFSAFWKTFMFSSDDVSKEAMRSFHLRLLLRAF